MLPNRHHSFFSDDRTLRARRPSHNTRGSRDCCWAKHNFLSLFNWLGRSHLRVRRSFQATLPLRCISFSLWGSSFPLRRSGFRGIHLLLLERPRIFAWIFSSHIYFHFLRSLGEFRCARLRPRPIGHPCKLKHPI
jgi:hypothetical protein